MLRVCVLALKAVDKSLTAQLAAGNLVLGPWIELLASSQQARSHTTSSSGAYTFWWNSACVSWWRCYFSSSKPAWFRKTSADTSVSSLVLQTNRSFTEIDGAALVCASWCSAAM